MSNNIKDNLNNYCTGCGACVATCPMHAIYYKLNEEGFYQAFVDNKKCIHCGKCKKVCTKFLKNEELGKKLEVGKLYAAQSKDANTVKTCTSGGIAFEIAKYGIQNGYQIFGTIYDYKENIAKAIIAKNMEEIELLKGSKYIQSNTGEALKELMKKCKENSEAKFIVFGTPCQILGISKMIKVNNIKNEIIKIDLFCHGVPSYLVWNNYIENVKEKYSLDIIDEVIFRDKKLGWHNYCLKIRDNEKNYYENSEKSIFYKIFFDTILYNKSCFECPVRKERTQADVRLGDFWGKKYINKNDGISAVIIYSEEGKRLIKNLNNLKIEEENIDECLKNQSTDNYKFIDLRDKYIKELQNDKNLEKIMKNYRKELPVKRRMKNYAKTILSAFPIKIRLIAKKMYQKIIYK